jgi:5-methylcytosine-specific restriction endonuclease McrA
MSYRDDLLDGRWQKKRLSVMNRDDFRCRACSTTNRLTVHHLYYETGKSVWEYEDESLVTLCQDCHNGLHKDLMKLSGIIAFEILTNRIDAVTFANL